MNESGQERAVNRFFEEENREKESGWKKTGRFITKTLLLLAETVVLAAVILYAVMFVLAKGPSPTIQKLFVNSVKETSAVGFLADLYLSEDEIAALEAVKETEEYDPTDMSLFTEEAVTSEGSGPQRDAWGLVDEDGDGIIIDRVYGEGFSGFMMVVLDPSRVIVGSKPGSFGSRGYTVAEFVGLFHASAGINAGGFDDPNGMGTGSTPDTLVVYDGTIYQPGRGCGDGIAAIDEDGILHVANSMSVDELHENRIRYAVCYGPVLISNGNPADPETLPESLNPRTAIGQRSDKAMLLLVIDGRQVSSMGASYQDLVEIMQHYGAVNAVNLDGGSSSLMWYNGSYINKTASVIGIRPVPTSILVLQEGQTP
ncbi:MAG: phosphodiester glycosidase family protein [Oscillospiraceae bacterium]|nr:phosphodiester glycosidase family protein [Oscillospiraceae bacterium]MBR3185155.1 phosphodiester glycosidase family protein [Oscillospiraceae bacterium]